MGTPRDRIAGTAKAAAHRALHVCATQRTDSRASASHSHGMNTKKSMSCKMGRHHWEITTVTGMREQTCVHGGPCVVGIIVALPLWLRETARKRNQDDATPWRVPCRAT
jgi:hypothetical protein